MRRLIAAVTGETRRCFSQRGSGVVMPRSAGALPAMALLSVDLPRFRPLLSLLYGHILAPGPGKVKWGVGNAGVNLHAFSKSETFRLQTTFFLSLDVKRENRSAQ